LSRQIATLDATLRGVSTANAGKDNRPGELFDPLVNGATVGTPINVTFLAEQGARLDSLGSRIVYTLPRCRKASRI
jgi:hypothetical protein